MAAPRSSSELKGRHEGPGVDGMGGGGLFWDKVKAKPRSKVIFCPL